ncbi:anti-sigma factor [Actinoplanes sp. NPDC024001]|uniref:anti-sigma factor n=1 Tax=Actinoplanes sp. NPDC024001 TaxID=3154598 RepID=UPI0033C74AF3
MTADVHSLIGAYALDALDDVERAAFHRHLRDCESCRIEADELREAAARLADGAWSVPPPRLRDNVMAAVAGTRQRPPRVAPSRSRTPRRLRLVAAAAAVVAAVSAGTVVYTVQDQRVRRANTLAEAAREGEARVRAILAAPDLKVREEPLDSGGRVTVASSPLQNAGVIMLAADGAPGSGKVYQLWTIRSGAATSAGALGEGQSAAVQLVEGLPDASNVGVTVERAPGSTAPTAPLDALVSLT